MTIIGEFDPICKTWHGGDRMTSNLAQHRILFPHQPPLPPLDIRIVSCLQEVRQSRYRSRAPNLEAAKALKAAAIVAKIAAAHEKSAVGQVSRQIIDETDCTSNELDVEVDGAVLLAEWAQGVLHDPRV